MRQLKLLSNLKDPLHFSVFFGASAIFFSASYLIMAALPGERDSMCVAGGGLTFDNIAFAVILSLTVGVMLAGYVNMIRAGWSKNKMTICSLSGSALVVGVLTLFCTLCTIPLISLFGLSVTLWFVSQYILLFQILSLLLMGFALFLMERQLRGICFFTPSVKKMFKRKFFS